ncbi:MAG TPA: HAD family hydrolase [Treponema sp.]|nr:HAD family hydrolase [Treponema sp.]
MKLYNLPPNPRAILFDIDCTLYTSDLWAEEQIAIQVRHFAGLRGVLEAEAFQMIEQERSRHEKETGKKTSLGNALTAFGVPIAESIRWRETLLEPQQFLNPDTVLRKVLISLGERFSLAAVTNNPTIPATKTLEALGVLDLFPILVGLDTTGMSKPHPEPYLTAARELGVPSNECISVGDRYDIDIAIPLELGMGGILVDGVHDVYELPKLLQRFSLKNSSSL